VRGMGSHPRLPLTLEEADANPSLRMSKLRASLFRPPDIVYCSTNGVNLICRSGAASLAAAATPPRAYATVDGARVPKLKRVTAMGTPVPTSGRIFAAAVGHVPPAGFCWALPH